MTLSPGQQIPVFVVSLARDVDRRSSISASLDSLGIEFEFIDAVDARTLTEADLRNLAIRDMADQSMGEIACSLSHQNVYKKMSEDDVPWAVILEDDVIVDARFRRLVSALGKAAQDRLKTDHIYVLGGQEGLDTGNRLALSFFNRISIGGVYFRKVTHKPEWVLTTCCYLISAQTGAQMRQAFSRCYYIADSWGYLHAEGVFSGFYLAEIISHPKPEVGTSHLESAREIRRQSERKPRKVRKSKSQKPYSRFKRFIRQRALPESKRLLRCFKLN